MRTAEPKGPGLEITALGDNSQKMIESPSNISLSAAGGSSGTFVLVDINGLDQQN